MSSSLNTLFLAGQCLPPVTPPGTSWITQPTSPHTFSTPPLSLPESSISSDLTFPCSRVGELNFSCSYKRDREEQKRTLGLILLQADESLEEDAKVLIPSSGARLHHVRIPSSLEVSEESLLALKDDIGAAASRFPASGKFDSIAFCCTSASSVIGSRQVEAIIRANCRAQLRCVTNPLVAAIAAFNVLGVTRVGLVSPYVASVNVALIKAFKENDIEVTHSGSFGQEEESKVARIDEESLVRACLELYEDSKKNSEKKFDAIFMSCTNLVTLGAIPRVEAATGLPALSSNLCLCWHMGVQAGGGLELDIEALGGTNMLLQRSLELDIQAVGETSILLQKRLFQTP